MQRFHPKCSGVEVSRSIEMKCLTFLLKHCTWVNVKLHSALSPSIHGAVNLDVFEAPWQMNATKRQGNHRKTLARVSSKSIFWIHEGVLTIWYHSAPLWTKHTTLSAQYLLCIDVSHTWVSVSIVVVVAASLRLKVDAWPWQHQLTKQSHLEVYLVDVRELAVLSNNLLLARMWLREILFDWNL